MKFHESIEYVRKVEGTVFALLEDRQELFVIYHDNITEAYTNTMLRVSGEPSWQEDYDPEEFYFEYEDVLDSLDFNPCKRDVTDLLDNYFWYVLEEVAKFRLTEEEVRNFSKK